MAKQIEHKIFIDPDGEFFVMDKEYLKERIARHLGVNKMVSAVFTVVESDNTNAQYGYYNAAIVPAVIEGELELNGETLFPDEAKDMLQQSSPHTRKEVRSNGIIHVIGRSTASIGKQTMAKHIDWCIKTIAEWYNINVPSPEQYYESLKVDSNTKFGKKIFT